MKMVDFAEMCSILRETPEELQRNKNAILAVEETKYVKK